MKLRMLWITYQIDHPKGSAIRAAIKDAHLASVDQHADNLVLGGASVPDNGLARYGSCLIVNMPDRAAAERSSENEPFAPGMAQAEYNV